MKKAFLILTFLITPLVFFAQQTSKTFKIKGSAVDSISQKSVPFATISVSKLPANTVVKKLVTDPDGQFEFDLKATGTYELVLQMMGYRATTKKFTVSATDKLIDLKGIGLSEQSQSINEVQIIAQKSLVKVDAEKLTYNTDQDPDSKTNNVMDMLRKVPLVTVDGEDNIQLKGNSSFKIFINGKPSSMLTNNPKDVLKSMPANMVKNIEIITSPGAKYDAEGVGGIINIITQKNTMQGYSANVNVGANTLKGTNAGAYLAITSGKFSFSTNLSFNSYNNPSLNSTNYKVDSIHPESYYSQMNGYNKNRGYSSFGNGELSYEIDSLNLISGSFNFWHGENSSNNFGNTVDSTKSGNRVMEFDLTSENKGSYGGPQANIDYQHTFKRNKEQTLTFSYNVNYNPNTSSGSSNIKNILNYNLPNTDNSNKAHNTEQTGQIDYVHPISEGNRLEIGSKIIYRSSSSESDYNTLINNDKIASSNTFDYTQKILSGYLSYNYKYKSLSARAGVRYENTKTEGSNLDVAVNVPTSSVFINTNRDWVPNASVGYQITPSQNIKLSYNLRIQRPGIWYLNPYLNKIDPQNQSQGNEKLESEKFDNIDLNYNIFGALGNINLSTSYMHSGNSIDRITRVTNNVNYTTYENAAKTDVFNNSVNAMLRVKEKLTLSVNGSLAYRKLESNISKSTNQGWNYNGNANMQYMISKGFKVSAYGGLFVPAPRLQAKYSTFYYSGLSVSREFFNGAMTASVSGQNIFWNTMRFKYETFDKGFSQTSTFDRPGRSFSMNLSFRLGNMNTQVKKTDRGIKNDDVKSGESGS